MLRLCIGVPLAHSEPLCSSEPFSDYGMPPSLTSCAIVEATAHGETIPLKKKTLLTITLEYAYNALMIPRQGWDSLVLYLVRCLWFHWPRSHQLHAS
jgi:hypothetical protein